MIRKLEATEVQFTLEIEDEDIPVRGYAMASGDDQADKEAEDDIFARLARGDQWAWCCVVVKATWKSYVGHATLGACSYANEADFCQPGGYFDDMKAEALDQLNKELAQVGEEIAPLVMPDPIRTELVMKNACEQETHDIAVELFGTCPRCQGGR